MPFVVKFLSELVAPRLVTMERAAMFRKHAGLRFAGFAGLGAVVLIAAGCAGTPPRPSYLRIAVSEKSVVHIQFQGEELRAAMSVEALPDAKPVGMAAMDDAPWFETVPPLPAEVQPTQRFNLTLPLPPDELPAGLTALRATFLDGALALTFCRPDAGNVEWRGRTRWLPYKTALTPADAPVVAAPDIAKMKLEVTGVPTSGELGIGLTLVVDRYPMYLMRTDRKGVAAQVRVVDGAGKEVVLKQGTLDDFGFSCDGPCYSVRTPKGAYMVEASIEAGPFGGTLKAQAKFDVP